MTPKYKYDTREHRLSNQIRIKCGELNWLCFHINVGKIRMSDGTYFNTGVPPGYPDLTIFTDKGTVLFIETKIKPRKPTAEQLHFIDILRERGFTAEVIYTYEEFLSLIKRFT